MKKKKRNNRHHNSNNSCYNKINASNNRITSSPFRSVPNRTRPQTAMVLLLLLVEYCYDYYSYYSHEYCYNYPLKAPIRLRGFLHALIPHLRGKPPRLGSDLKPNSAEETECLDLEFLV